MRRKAVLTGVYCIRNVVSGRTYIGSAANIRKRWRLHLSRLRLGNHHSLLLQRSWEKHGPGAFVFRVIEFCGPADLVKREQRWIDAFDSCNPKTGFNVAPKAGSSLGRKHPPEVIALMSAQRRGRKHPLRSEAWCAALSASRIGNQWGKGIPKTAEHRRKLSEAKKGRKCPWVAESNKRRAAARATERMLCP